jgi:hypothetical protein
MITYEYDEVGEEQDKLDADAHEALHRSAPLFLVSAKLKHLGSANIDEKSPPSLRPSFSGLCKIKLLSSVTPDKKIDAAVLFCRKWRPC